MDDIRTAGRPRISSSPRRERERIRYAAKRRLKLCAWCGASSPDRSLCTGCRETHNANQKATREALRVLRLCHECRRPTAGKIRCKVCAEIRNLRPSRQAPRRRGS